MLWLTDFAWQAMPHVPCSFLPQSALIGENAFWQTCIRLALMRKHRASVHCFVLSLALQTAGMLVKVLRAGRGVYLRVLQCDASNQRLLARVELVNLWIWAGTMLP
jgi:hypothetical protein